MAKFSSPLCVRRVCFLFQPLYHLGLVAESSRVQQGGSMQRRLVLGGLEELSLNVDYIQSSSKISFIPRFF